MKGNKYLKSTAVIAALAVMILMGTIAAGRMNTVKAQAKRHADPQKITWVCGRENNVPIGLTDGKQNFAGVTYTSMDTSLIRVTEKTGRLGIVETDKTKKTGKTYIVLALGGQKYYCVVKKVNPKMSKTKLELVLGGKETAKLKMSGIKDVNNKNLPCIWNSTNQEVAIVKNGKVTAKKPGKTTITCDVDGQVTYKCEVKVSKNEVTGISLDQEQLTMAKETEAVLKASVTPENAAEPKGRWVSDDKLIATVDENGVVTAHKAGTTTIKAVSVDDSAIQAVCVVTVTEI